METSQTMNISSILVVVPPRELASTLQRLAALPGVEAHHSDAATGRIVATLEAATIEDEQAGLAGIQALPHVIQAEMACHYVGADPA